MSENAFVGKMKELYKNLCVDEWNANMTGVLVALFSILIAAWWRPWGAVGAIRNWGDWILYGVGAYGDAPDSILTNTGSVIGIGFVAGAFISACLGNNFAFRVPPVLEMAKAVVAGLLMGLGAALSGGCNVGGFYNAIGNLSAHGFAMMLGLIVGAIIGLKYVYWEMENISWGSGGAKTVELPKAVQVVLGVAAVVLLVWGAYGYAADDESVEIASLSGLILIAACLGYCMQRGRWCMIQGFREPHMTGNCTMAKSVALSICILAVGTAVLKYGVPARLEGVAVLDKAQYVRGTFGWGAVVGGLIFGFAAILVGGCGTGTLWRVGEGQIKLWLVVPFFAISNSLITKWFKGMDLEGAFEDGAGKLGSFVFMPDTFLGYGGTLILILLVMAVWYLVVEWNEETNKFVVEM